MKMATPRRGPYCHLGHSSGKPMIAAMYPLLLRLCRSFAVFGGWN